MRAGESSIEQRHDMRICIVQRILDGMSQRKSEAVEKECRPLEGQTDMMDFHCSQICAENK